MISFIIKNARKRHTAGFPTPWLVLHPDNDAILAICDTEAEADSVLMDLEELAELIADLPLFSRGSA